MLNSGAYFEGKVWDALDLQGVRIEDKEFYKCEFRNAKLGGSSWTGSVLENCVFTGCDLTRLNPQRMTLRDVRFLHSKLMGIDWSNASRSLEVHFEDCNMQYCSFVGAGLRKTQFLRCQLNDANFIDCDIVEAVFDGSDLSGATIRRCDLTKAKLGTALGVFFEPAQNKSKNAEISIETALLLAQAQGLKIHR